MGARGSNTVSAIHAFGAQLKSKKTSFQSGCSIHPTYTLLLAIKILFVNCYCTFLLPVLSLNAPNLCQVCKSVLDLLWISPDNTNCTSTKKTKSLIQPSLRSRSGSCLSAIVHLNKFPFIAFSAGVSF